MFINVFLTADWLITFRFIFFGRDSILPCLVRTQTQSREKYIYCRRRSYKFHSVGGIAQRKQLQVWDRFNLFNYVALM